MSDPSKRALPTSDSSSLEEDDLFHCTLLSIQVENRIFRVPKELLETSSSVFKDMFGLPVRKNEAPDGERDSAPLTLEGIKKEDFRAFLSVLSSLHYETVTKRGEARKGTFVIASLPLYEGLQKKDWIAALRLSHMWDVENVRKKSIKVLEGDATVDMLQKLKLANELQITSWVRPAYQYLLTRAEDTKSSEVDWLDLDFTQRVARAREERTKLFLLRIWSQEIGIPVCPSCGEARLKLQESVRPKESSPKGESNRQVEPLKWYFKCNGSSTSLHLRNYVIQNRVSGHILRGSWTVEELVDSVYKSAHASVKSLMDKDVDLLIDRFLPMP
ncbi:hypothetical protein SCHPADRAFT_1003234 [Schizopora paradoxa]|uniref:BTB domain-containing protein n=1 Tax=Schizopora paradoxa TaxID=27342 RepID=A0A0H2R5B6_9AGAM|nr:hypothetical protein SCHPADRAFT_1003234 [Schizopora paradoxa]